MTHPYAFCCYLTDTDYMPMIKAACSCVTVKWLLLAYLVFGKPGVIVLVLVLIYVVLRTGYGIEQN